MSPPFRLITLGRLELTQGGAPTGVRRRKELGLLAYLARRAPGSVDRDVAMALFWGDRPEAKARTSLRQALFELRAVVGDGVLAERSELRVDPALLAVDATEFEADLAAGRLRDAVERWGGVFLPGLEDLGDERWASWLEGERAALTHRMIAALDQLGAAAEATGEWAAVTRYAERQLELDPEGAEARRRLLVGYRRTGADAKAAAFEARSGLGSEQRGIGRPGVRGLVTPDLIGRTTALADLRAAFDDVSGGAATIVVIEGEPGIGKSRFLAEAVRSLPVEGGRAVVASTRAFASQQDRPWSVLRPLLAVVVGQAKGVGAVPPEMLAGLAGPVPEVAERFPSLPPAVPTIDPGAAAIRLVADAAVEQPIVLVVDDAPDADPESLVALGELVRHPPRGLLLVLAGRPDAWRASPLGADLKDIEPIALARLTERQVGDLIGSMAPFGPGEAVKVATLVHREAGGVPGLVQTLVGQLAEAGSIGPDGDGTWRARGDLTTVPIGGDFRTRVLEAIGSLPAEARSLLDLAAVLGPTVDQALLERAGGLDPARFQQALGTLVTGRHLREPARGPGPLEFGSDAVRRAVYDGLVPSVRAGLHRRAAAALRSRSDPHAIAEARRHRDAAGRRGLPPRWLMAGAVAALLVLAAWWRFAPGRLVAPAPGTAVLLADPTNATDQPIFDGSLGVVARVGLQQSRRVWLVPHHQIRSALARMGRPDSGVLVRGELAREVAMRENVPLIVELALNRAGNEYLVAARLVEARSGADLVSYAARARGQDGVLDAIDQVVGQISDALGESIAADSTGGLARVTTTSLAALQQFSLGEAAWDGRRFDAAARYWERATELDSTFGMAHARLALFLFQNRSERPLALARVALAERYADRMTEPERLLLAATKAGITGDRASARQARSMLAARYPTPANLNNYGLELFRGQMCREAIPFFEHAIALRPAANAWVNLATCHQTLDSLEPALRAYGEADALDSTLLYDLNVNQEWGLLLVRAGRPAAAESVFRRMTERPTLPNQARGFRSLAFVAMHQGRYHDALAALEQSLSRYRSAESEGLPLFRTLVLEAHAAASLGRAEAAGYLARADRAMEGRFLDPLYRVRILAAHLRLGDRAAAGRALASLRSSIIPTSRADSVALRLGEALVASAAGNWRAALAQLGSDPASNPPLVSQYWAAKGAAYRGLGLPDSALAAWRRARQRWGGGTEAQDDWDRLPLAMAEAALQIGDTAQATTLLQSLVTQWARADSEAVAVVRARRLFERITVRRRPGPQ